jgi:hypothetical protein
MEHLRGSGNTAGGDEGSRPLADGPLVDVALP